LPKRLDSIIVSLPLIGVGTYLRGTARAVPLSKVGRLK